MIENPSLSHCLMLTSTKCLLRSAMKQKNTAESALTCSPADKFCPLCYHIEIYKPAAFMHKPCKHAY